MTVPVPPASTSRFAQMTYSSFDPRSGGREDPFLPDPPAAGGWQVKESRGALTADEAEALRERISTQFDAGGDLPDFPTEEEREQLPRRLVYAPVPGHGAAYWHTVPAGLDGSGRPGNVFVHMLLDRDPGAVPTSEGDTWRPIDLWRSPDWLTPYNAAAVVAATLGPLEHPRPGSRVSREAVVGFVLDPSSWRVGVLAGLLDAVHEALAGGPRVVLGVGDTDRAALWIGAVSHLMAAGTSRSFCFSTFERPASLPAAWGQGVHLACVPRGDLERVPTARDLVVLDDEENLEMGAWGFAPHVTERGSRIEVTRWSNLAQVVMLEQRDALAVLEHLDDVALTVGDRGLAVPWPLAMAALGHPRMMADVREDAARIISADTPDRVQDHPDLLELALDAVRRLVGGGAANAWAYVTPTPDGGRSLVQELVEQAYAAEAVRDPEWLLRPGGVPLPDNPAELRYEAALEAADEITADLERRAREAPEEGRGLLARHVTRLADVALRLGMIPQGATGRADVVRERLEDLLERLVVPVLLEHDEARSFLDAAFPVESVRELVRPLVEIVVSGEQRAGRGRLGERLAAVVLDFLGWSRWLEQDPTGRETPLSAESLRDALRNRQQFDAVDREHAVAHLALPEPEPMPPYVWAVGVIAVLDELAAGRGVAVELEEVLRDVGATADHLAVLVHAYGDLVPERALLEVLAREPWTDDLARLVYLVASAEAGPGREAVSSSAVRDLAELREAAHVLLTQVSDAHELRSTAGRVIHLAGSLADLPVSVADEAAAAARLAVVASYLLWAVTVNPDDAVAYPAWPGASAAGQSVWEDLLQRRLHPELDESCVALLGEWIEQGMLDVNAVVRLVVRGAPRFPEPSLVPPAAKHLMPIRAAVDGVTAPLLEHVLWVLLAARQTDTGALARSFADGVSRDLVARGVQRSAAREAETTAARFAEARLRLLAPRGRLLAGALSRFRRP